MAVSLLKHIINNIPEPTQPPGHSADLLGSAWTSLHGALKIHIPALRAHPILAHPDDVMTYWSLSFLMDSALVFSVMLSRNRIPSSEAG